MGLELGDVIKRNTDGSYYVLGTVVLAPGTGVVTVNVRGSLLVLPHLRGYVPAVNDTVMIMVRGQSRFVIDAVTNPVDPVAPRSDAPAPTQPTPKPPPAPTPPKVTKTSTFLAAATACYRGGKWRTDNIRPHQGDWGNYGNNTGAWFYGTGIRSALKGAVVLSAKVYLKRVDGGVFAAQTPTVYTTPHPAKPAGAPTLQGGGTNLSSAAVGQAKWVTFPTALAQAFVDGTAYGLACKVSGDSPYIVFAQLSESRSSGALSITYRK